VNRLTNAEDLISDLEAVKEEMRKYFSSLYSHNPPPNIAKLWLTTPAVNKVKEHV
jgi:hypothetical protein